MSTMDNEFSGVETNNSRADSFHVSGVSMGVPRRADKAIFVAVANHQRAAAYKDWKPCLPQTYGNRNATQVKTYPLSSKPAAYA